MTSPELRQRSPLPSVDRLLKADAMAGLIERHGRQAVVSGVREVLDQMRPDARRGAAPVEEAEIVSRLARFLDVRGAASLRPVFNLTGTVLHTNLGRAPLPDDAIEAMAEVGRAPANLEFDLSTGRRGDRDSHVEEWLCRLTGAEAATVVNNNAAAVLLVLNTLALGREVPVSRGELIEIGGSFRMPDIMARAGCKLREVGTTNRTHRRDFEAAIGPETGLVMAVHTSNYVIDGFTAAVPERELSEIARAAGVPFAVDLGSGTLVDLTRFGLPHEPTAQEALARGADLVTFSGDKLLGGPQAGIIVGRADLIAEIKRNPMKRALRLDKMTIAALGAVLRLYADPDRLAERLPALRLMTRPLADIEAQAARLAPEVQSRLGDLAKVEAVACESQIGSGALPVEHLPSAGLAIRPRAGKQGPAAEQLLAMFRHLPTPVIARLSDGACILDLRCLEEEDMFLSQFAALHPDEDAAR